MKLFNRVVNYTRVIFSVAIPLVITIVFLFVNNFGVFKGWDTRFYDSYFRWKPMEQKHQSNITIITIDEVSLDVMMKNRIFWQWPQEVY